MTTDRLQKGALLGGFALLTVAVAVAHRHPAHAYEVSVYTGTPRAYWVGVGAALLLAVWAGFAAGERLTRAAAAVLTGASALSVAALPLLRRYYYYGEPDAMTHLGWAREIQARLTAPTDIIYPGIHLNGVSVSALLGVDVPTALMLVVAVFVLTFLVFVTLAVRHLVSTDAGLIVGAASAGLFLPINNIAVELTPHPISQSALYFAFVLYLALQYVIPTDDARPQQGGLSAHGVLLALTSLAVVVYHPQMALTVLVLYGAISAAQWYFRRRHAAPFTDHRPLYAQTLFLAVAFVAWVSVHDVLVSEFAYVGRTILQALAGHAQVGTVVTQRSSSLTAVGSGPLEIFLKLFAVSALYVGLTALFLYSGLVERVRSLRWDGDAVATYMLFGGLGISAFSAVQFLGDFSRLVFRYLGILLVVGTILGGAELARRLDAPNWSALRTAGATAIVAALLALSLATAYPSPYTYQPSAHKTEAQMDGYAAAFAHDQPDVGYSGLGYEPWRFHDAVVLTGNDGGGQPDPERYRMNGILSPAVIHRNLTTHFEGGQYLPVTSADRARELRAVDGIMYNRSAFARLDATPGVDRLVATDGMTLYYVPPADRGAS